MLARAIAVVTLVAAVALLAACGGSDRDEQADAYVRAVNAAQARFERSATSASETGTDPRAARATLDRLSTAVDRVVRDLGAIEPPERVGRLHARLIGDMRGFRDVVRTARRGARTRSGARRLATRVTASAERTQRHVDATLRGIDRALRPA